MDRHSEENRLSKSEPISKQLSAFEMAINLEFQADAPQESVTTLKAGEPCPQCQSAKIDYDSMLNLSCSNCGYTLAGCFT